MISLRSINVNRLHSYWHLLEKDFCMVLSSYIEYTNCSCILVVIYYAKYIYIWMNIQTETTIDQSSWG